MTVGGGTAVGSAIIIASSVGVDTVSFGTTLIPSTGAKVIGATGVIVESNKLISGISQIFNGIYGREVKKGLNPIKDTLIYINPSGEYRDFYNALEVVTEVGVGQLAPYAIGVNKDKINPNKQNGNNLFYDGRKVYTEKELNNLEKTTGSPNRGIEYIYEKPRGNEKAQAFQSGTTGSVSDVATKNNIVPALRYDNPNERGRSYIKFDGIEKNGTYLIDSKTNIPYWNEKAMATTFSDTLKRINEAKKQNPDIKVIYEFPNNAAKEKLIKWIETPGNENYKNTIDMIKIRGEK
ncbi:hypothetical protein [Fusobacterium russii]|uniref:hypothetical protein n=1 Tax=Fusobacterium russii TaxID=854 RepID=UPI0003A3187F|nr:hypothetical protein [Fusobacterium russii]